jgi:acyl-[acyl carrier protein]--UDP-N-acetylglucosamine O-acyltransferase
METTIGSNTTLGAHTHVGHDGQIADDVIVNSRCSFGGYVIIGKSAHLGVGTIVHQRVAIGGLSMCGAGAVVTRHVHPFATVAGVPARYLHLNRRGLERAGWTSDAIEGANALLEGRSSEPPRCGLTELLLNQFRADQAKWGRSKGCLPNSAS